MGETLRISAKGLDYQIEFLNCKKQDKTKQNKNKQQTTNKQNKNKNKNENKKQTNKQTDKHSNIYI